MARELLFENLNTGDKIPPIIKKPTNIMLFRYGAVSFHPSRIHYDKAYAQYEGFPDVIAQADLFGAFLAQMLNESLGTYGMIKRLAWRNTGVAIPGDVLTCGGKVLGKYSRDGQNYADCELWVDNQKDARVAPGSATILFFKPGEVIPSLSPLPVHNGSNRSIGIDKDSIITEHGKSVIGKWNSPALLGVVALRDMQRYAIAVGDLSPLYLNDSYAKSSRYGGIIAPPTFLTSIRVWGAGTPEKDLDPSGRDSGVNEIMAFVRANRLVGGGQELEFHQVVRPGDAISRRIRVKDIYEKEGKTGKLAFIVRESEDTNQKGEVLVTCLETFIAL